MQYAWIFRRKKSLKKNVVVFNILAQNIHCGYTLEPPCQSALTSIHNVCFGSKIRKIGIPLQTSVFYIKVGFKMDIFSR